MHITVKTRNIPKGSWNHPHQVAIRRAIRRVGISLSMLRDLYDKRVIRIVESARNVPMSVHEPHIREAYELLECLAWKDLSADLRQCYESELYHMYYGWFVIHHIKAFV